MPKFALIDTTTGVVKQWQDHEQFGYADAAAGEQLVPLADDFAFPETPHWYIDGQLTDAAPSPAPTAAQLLAELQQGVVVELQRRLDAFAATRGYDNVNSIAKYQSISDDEISALPADMRAAVSKFRTECRSVAVQVAATWAACYAGLALVESGQQPTPATVDEAIEQLQLPALAWPV